MVRVDSSSSSSKHHHRKRSSSSSNNRCCFGIKEVCLVLLSGGVCFYAGIMFGIHIGYQQGEQQCLSNVKQEVKSRIQFEQQHQQQRLEQEENNKEDNNNEVNNNNNNNNKQNKKKKKAGSSASFHNYQDSQARFPVGMSSFAQGMGYVSRDDFTSKFDLGVPLDKTTPENNAVLLLYGGMQSLPTSDPRYASELTTADDNGKHVKMPFMDDVGIAVENCDVLNVILTQPKAKEQCTAIMGQYNSYHIQKLMRIPAVTEGLQGKALAVRKELPLRHVNRNAKTGGGLSIKIPTVQHTNDSNRVLAKYLETLDDVLKQLEPIAASVASHSYNKKTIIVMVTNYGQSELLMNFVCAARSRGFHSLLKTVLIFATDNETKELAEGMGLNVFYDEVNFKQFPKNAARRYADKTFTSVMMAKVYCVQMTNVLGYDLLFQDVDMIWYKDPIEFFKLPSSGGKQQSSQQQPFDIYFQDDGNHGLYYAPYSANTGFYFVRQNERTRYFFSCLLRSGDLITSTKSHQVALISLLAEHASMYGLRVKVLSKEEFPGGFHFNQRSQRIYMRTVMENYNRNITNPKKNDKDPQKNADPYIFHMSWTHNKDNKIKYFQQMGEWHYNEQCIDKQPYEIKQLVAANNHESFTETCCLKEPMFKCHYRDKPSLHSCKDSPPIDAGGPSFWP